MKKIENEILILLARDRLEQEHKKHLSDLFNENIDWQYLQSQLERHKLHALFLAHVTTGAIPQPPSEVMHTIESTANSMISKTNLLDADCIQLVEMLNANSIDYAVLKGPILAHSVYANPKKRIYSDIDILVKREDCEVIGKILRNIGYIQGKVIAGNKIKPASRKELRWCQLYIHHLFPFVRLEDEKSLEVEVHTDLFDHNHKSGKALYILDLSAKGKFWKTIHSINVRKHKILTPSWEYFLLHLCLHTYNDEITIGKVAYGKSGVLRAYSDIRDFLCSKRNEISWSTFVEIVEESKAQEPVYYVFSNLFSIYEETDDIVKAVLVQIQPSNLSFINEFGLPWQTLTEQRGQWSRPFIERLFDNSGQEDFERQRHLFGDPNWAKIH